MKIEIRVGDVSTNKRIKYTFDKNDDINSEKKRMYDFLENCNDCIIEDVDNFLLYTFNNGLMSYIIKDNPKHEDEDCHLIPKFNTDIYRVFEIKEDGTEILMQDKEGNIRENYFNKLMGCIMDDFYSCLNYFPYTKNNL